MTALVLLSTQPRDKALFDAIPSHPIELYCIIGSAAYLVAGLGTVLSGYGE
jgi:hypothetical protein